MWMNFFLGWHNKTCDLLHYGILNILFKQEANDHLNIWWANILKQYRWSRILDIWSWLISIYRLSRNTKISFGTYKSRWTYHWVNRADGLDLRPKTMQHLWIDFTNGSHLLLLKTSDIWCHRLTFTRAARKQSAGRHGHSIFGKSWWFTVK